MMDPVKVVLLLFAMAAVVNIALMAAVILLPALL
jgi:hypothetical protein